MTREFSDCRPSISPVVEDTSQRVPADIGLCFLPAMNEPWEWESAVGKCVAFMGNGSHGVLEFAFPPVFLPPRAMSMEIDDSAPVHHTLRTPSQDTSRVPCA